jgi:hypothetical protein
MQSYNVVENVGIGRSYNSIPINKPSFEKADNGYLIVVKNSAIPASAAKSF